MEAEVDPRDDEKSDYEDHEEEHGDADAAESDEEQLVNVKNDSTPNVDSKEGEAGGHQASGEKDKFKDSKSWISKDKAMNPNRPKNSFSLSLAGSSEYDDTIGVNRVMSMPSDSYTIKQMPGFHARILRPFYAHRPVSNVVMGLIRGTSLYAKQSVLAKLATIIHTNCGWFFIMPNPKYHTEVDSRKGLLSKETGKFRFVAWWIHPRFVPQMRQWFGRLTEDQGQGDRTGGDRWATKRGAGDISGSAAAAPDGSSSYGGSGSTGGGVALDRRDSGHGNPTSAQAGQGSGAPGSGGVAAAVSDGRGPDRNAGGPGDRGGGSGQQGRSTAGASSSEPGQQVGGGDVGGPSPAQMGEEADAMGSPGDFRFSDVPKPDSYLHTYRDLHSKEHVNMLIQLREGTYRFLRSLFDDSFMAHASISAGFHYPVRTQYATLHMQVRVNSGSVCREDGRGIEVDQLVEKFKRNRGIFERDEETLRYQVTENVKVSLLAAAQEYEASTQDGNLPCRQLTPTAWELGCAAMPTIQDGDEEEEEHDDQPEQVSRKSSDRDSLLGSSGARQQSPSSPGGHRKHEEEVAKKQAPKMTLPKPQPDSDLARMAQDDDMNKSAVYLVNLQPSLGSTFHKIMYKLRQRSREAVGPDPTHLYPLHVSVTGFFEVTGNNIRPLVTGMQQLLQAQLSENSTITVGKVICTETGYVLFDMKAPAVTLFAQNLNSWSIQQLGLAIRPKAVNHISLASNRPDEAIRERIRRIFEPGPDEDGGAEATEAAKNASFDLVLSRLVQRATFEKFEEEGGHRFLEVARIPVGWATSPNVASPVTFVQQKA